MKTTDPPFRESLARDLDAFVSAERRRFPDEETLVIDLHCHDHGSDVPDEILGRILHWPETWVGTDEVREALARNGATALTLTNHNSARSCYELLERGIDALVGAEFTCTVPDFEVHVHVLTYGFSPAQEQRLLELRRDLYRFLGYAREQDLVTVLAHPLYFYSTHRVPTLPLLEKLTLLFDSFEVLNGQRDTWQNLLCIAWLQSLTEERVEDMAKRARLRPDAFSRRPVAKTMTGGSDDHMALFVGTTGSRVRVPDLARRLRTEERSALVLEALRRGEVAPFGHYTGEEKLAASFLDYFCQIVKHASDPGLLRMLLHQGAPNQKICAFLVANAISELRRHRYTSRFIAAAHEALHGKHLGFMQRYAFAKEYRPLIKELDQIAGMRRDNPAGMDDQLRTSIPAIFRALNAILAGRIKAKVDRYEKEHQGESSPSPQQLIDGFELPADLRTLFGSGGAGTDRRARGMSSVDLKSLAEGLPFPALAALVIGGSTYASTRVLFANRPLLDEFSQAIGRYQHPKRVLWLTDTFEDQNGVASALRLVHAEAVRRDLPTRTLKLDPRNTDRVRRLLRAFYRRFDGLFVLSAEHMDWLASDAIGIPRARLRRTAHWADPRFRPRPAGRREAFPGLGEDERVLLFVGRVSEEKGVLELPAILEAVRREVPRARLCVVGAGPAEDRLRALVPDGIFLSWVAPDELARIYPAADVLVFPSRFDTFGCVVLEALASGLPVVAYRTKGPRDIIQDGVCGFTASDQPRLAAAIVRILCRPELRARLRAGAVGRAKAYGAESITNELLQDLGLSAGHGRGLMEEPELKCGLPYRSNVTCGSPECDTAGA